MNKLYVSPYRCPGGNEKTAALRALFDGVRAAKPAVRFCPERDPFPEDPRIKALRFSGLSFEGRENTVFAYIGFPETAAPDRKVPGMVLVHGGGGHAYAEWVQAWVARGYAAISFDGFGQTYTGADHTYEASLDFWKPDPASHLPMDGFASVGKPVREQGFTYYIADVLLANTLLRADPRVISDQIGLTGISWGGIAASVAVCYDDRFAFAAPVYGCGFLDVSKTAWGEPFRGNDIANLWDAKLLLDTVKIPVRFYNGDGDPFFDANAVTASAAAVPDGSLTLLPGFTHGQIEGSSIPELFRFADAQTGRGERNITIDALSSDGDGAELCFSLPQDVGTAEVCLYYKTEDLFYEDKFLREAWKRKTADAGGGKAHISIPAGAQVFYFCVEGKPEGAPEDVVLHATTGVFSRETWENSIKNYEFTIQKNGEEQRKMSERDRIAQDRMMNRKWGIFNHYLYYSEKGYTDYKGENEDTIRLMAEEWNGQTASFDAEKLARTLHEIGCGYYVITVMQGTRFLLAPNAAYTRITGIAPGEACSCRDLIRDIGEALKPYDIDLFLYYTGDGPHFDKTAGPAMGLYEDYEADIHGKVDRRFVENWAAVLGEYAERYGDLVKGWWVDGCYESLGYNNELLSIYYNAIKKGNPDALAAFNSGTASFVHPDGDDTPIKWYENEGFTCGEDNDFTYVFKNRFTDGAQNHLLIPLGDYRDGNICAGWCNTGVRRSKEYVADYIRKNNAAGAVITVDIFVDHRGNFDPAQVEALKYVGQKVREA